MGQTGPVTIRVLHADGTPAVGAVVATIVGVGSAVDGSEKRTDADGRAAFSELEMTSSRAILVHWEGREAVLVARPDSGDLAVRLGAAVQVEGRVETTRGESVEGAICTIVSETPAAPADVRQAPSDAMQPGPEDAAERIPESLRAVASGADGAFRFPPLPHALVGNGMRVVAWVRQPNWDWGASPITGSPMVLRLRPPRAVRGRCVDETGRGVAGTALGSGENSPGANAQRDGTFVIENVPVEAFTLRVSAPTHAPASVLISAGRDDVDLAPIVLNAGLSVQGTVVDSDGRPVPGAQLRAGPEDLWWHRMASTGEGGTFTLPAMPAGEDVALHAWVNGVHESVAASERVVVRVAQDGATGPRLVIPSAGLIRIRFVRDSDGTSVSVRSITVGATPKHPTAFDRSDLGDTIVVSGGKPGTKGLHVRVNGWEPVAVTGIVVRDDGPTEVELRLTPAARSSPAPHGTGK